MLARPIISRISKRLRKFDVLDDAVETVEVDGPTEWELDRVIALPDEVERIRGHQSLSDPEANFAMMNGTSLKQAPSRMHRLRDVVIADGTVLTRRSYRSIQEQKRRWLLVGEPASMDVAVLCSSWLTQRFFGHWLSEGLPHELLAHQRGMPPVTLTGASWPHAPGYRELAQLAANPVSFARVADLWLLDDSELSRSRARRIEQIGGRLRAACPASGTTNVFIARGKLAVGRALGNEPEIVAALEGRGFTILRPEELTTEQIVRGLSGARMVVGAEGSAFSHALLAAPSTAGFLTMMGPRNFCLHYRPYAAARGIRFAYTIGDAVGAEGFTQPIDRLLKTIDLLDSALG